SLLLPRPPPSPLFPYTTLFRSGRCASANLEHVNPAIAAAQRAFPAWRRTPARDRADLLFRCAQIMRRCRFELAAWEIYETAKQRSEEHTSELQSRVDLVCRLLL